jgi:two-component system sensor histidine kinase KdpD
MLAEGQRLISGGVHVVVGLAETHGRQQTAAQLDDLEVVPPRRVDYRGSSFTELDLDAMMARQPEVALVDELAHTNVPGCRHEKRWQDVEALLDAGVDVVSTLNVQHIDSLCDAAAALSGVTQRETVPDDVVMAADRVDVLEVDATTLRARVSGGHLYNATDAGVALRGYYNPENLVGLHTLAQGWMDEHRLASSGCTRPAEKVVVALTGAPEGDHVTRRAAQLAEASGGKLIGVHVRQASGSVESEPAWLPAQRRLLTELGGEYAEFAGVDISADVVDFVRLERASHLVLGATRRSRRDEWLHGSVIRRTLRKAGPIEVHVIPSRQPAKGLEAARPRWRRPQRVPLPPRRQLIGWVLAVLAPTVITVALIPFRSSLGLPGALFAALLAVVSVALVGGMLPAAVATVVGFLLADFFFAVPIYSLRVDRLIDLVALIAFGCVAGVIGVLVDILARQGIRVARAQTEASAVARLAADVIGATPQAVQERIETVRRVFDLDAVSLLRPAGTGWVVDAQAGESVSSRLEDAQFAVELADRRMLVLAGGRLAEQDALLWAFAGQLRLGREQAQLTRIRMQMANRSHRGGRRPFSRSRPIFPSKPAHEGPAKTEDRP